MVSESAIPETQIVSRREQEAKRQKQKVREKIERERQEHDQTELIFGGPRTYVTGQEVQKQSKVGRWRCNRSSTPQLEPSTHFQNF